MPVSEDTENGEQLSIRDLFISMTGICIGLVLLRYSAGSQSAGVVVFIAGLFLSGGSLFSIIGGFYRGRPGAVVGLLAGGLTLSMSFVFLKIVFSILNM
jgi:hypothetical protein